MNENPGYLPEDAWFGGFFDGEGHVGITPPSRSSLYLLQVAVTQVDVAPLLLFRERFGGKVLGPYTRQGSNSRPISRWVAETGRAEAALRVLLPYLIVKRAQAELGLEFRELFKGENTLPRGCESSRLRNVRKRDHVMALRKDCYDRMRSLNKRGIS